MSTTAYSKPIPLKIQGSEYYWDAADRHELAVQKCDDCRIYLHPPGLTCTKCGSDNLSWEDLGNEITGKVYSYIVSYRPYLPGYENSLPLITAIVALDSIPEVKILANVLECTPDEIEIDLPVKMIWEELPDGRALPQWKK